MRAQITHISAAKLLKSSEISIFEREKTAQNCTPTLSIKRFGEAINKIEDDNLRVKVQLYYLTAARMSEASTKVSEWELLMLHINEKL